MTTFDLNAAAAAHSDDFDQKFTKGVGAAAYGLQKFASDLQEGPRPNDEKLTILHDLGNLLASGPDALRSALQAPAQPQTASLPTPTSTPASAPADQSAAEAYAKQLEEVIERLARTAGYQLVNPDGKINPAAALTGITNAFNKKVEDAKTTPDGLVPFTKVDAALKPLENFEKRELKTKKGPVMNRDTETVYVLPAEHYQKLTENLTKLDPSKP